jgi:nucleoside-diphosphate-sugar epimerase
MTARDICLTGATGFLGSHLTANLEKGGARLRALSRKAEGGMFVRGDLADPSAVMNLVTEGSTIVHLAYAHDLDNLAVAESLANAAITRGAGQFVHVSTAVVVGKTREDVVDESTPAAPVTEYEREKLEIERLLANRLQGRVALKILRPTAVFGSGGRNLISLAEHLDRSSRSRIALRMSVMGRRQMNLVAVENVVAAIVHLMSHDIAGPMIVNDDDSGANDYADVARLMMEGMGLAPLSAPVDLSFALSLALRVLGRRLENPKTTFSSRRLRESGYAPVIGFDDAVRRFGAWYRASSGSRS